MASLADPHLIDDEIFALNLEKARAGDRPARRAIFRAFNRPVAAMVAATAESDTNSVVNQVFVNVFRSLDRFSGTSVDFAAFIYHLTNFHLIDESRERRRNAADPTQMVDKQLVKIAAAMNALTAEQREVVTLRVLFGLTAAEAADALEKPVETIGWLQRRADARLCSFIADEAVQT